MSFSFRRSCDQLPALVTTAQTRQIFAPSSANQHPSLPRKDLFARPEIKLQPAYRAIKFIWYSILHKRARTLLKVPFLIN